MGNTTGKALKAGIAYTIGNIFLRGISFFTLPVFSRILTTEEFGLFNVYLAYETILTIFVGICLYGSLRTAKYDYKKEFGKYEFSILNLSILVFITFLFLGNILFPFYEEIFGFHRFILNILFFHSYAMFLFQFYNVKQALDYRFGRYLMVSGLNSMIGTLLSVFLILAVFTEQKHFARIAGYAFTPIVIALVLFIGMYKKGVKNHWKACEIKYWNYAVSISVPLVIHTFSQQILSQFDRIMIHKFVNARCSGVYSFINTFSNILQITIQSMDNAWSVWFYEQLSLKKYTDIYVKIKAYILLMNLFYIGFISVSPDIIRVFGTSDYWEGIPMIIPLSFAVYFMFLYSLPVHVEYYYKKTKYMALGTGCSAVVNLVLNFIFIPIFGYQAAAWTTFVSYFLLYLFHQIIAGRLEKSQIFPYRTICMSIVLLGFYSFWTYFCIFSLPVRWVSMAVMIGVMGFLNRKVLASMIAMVPLLNKVMKSKK